MIDGTQLLLPFVKIIKYLLGYGVALVETTISCSQSKWFISVLFGVFRFTKSQSEFKVWYCSETTYSIFRVRGQS